MYRKFIETNSGLDAAKIRKIFELCKSYAKIFENNLHFYGAAPVSIAGREGDEERKDLLYQNGNTFRIG